MIFIALSWNQRSAGIKLMLRNNSSIDSFKQFFDCCWISSAGNGSDLSKAPGRLFAGWADINSNPGQILLP
jgi:hypothetical protein